MGQYSSLTDEQLTQELADAQAAYKAITRGTQLKVIAGEGRRKEFSAGDLPSLKADLRELQYEFDSRPTLNPGGPDGGSLDMDFGRATYFGGYGCDY